MIGIGFTGSRYDMTLTQETSLRILLKRMTRQSDIELHNGCCVGSDYTAALIAHELGIPIVFHPPTKQDKMADLSNLMEQATFLEPKPYLKRNKDIVDCSTLLLATPRNQAEELRSGTWQTIRYAKSVNKLVIIL